MELLESDGPRPRQARYQAALRPDKTQRSVYRSSQFFRRRSEHLPRPHSLRLSFRTERGTSLSFACAVAFASTLSSRQRPLFGRRGICCFFCSCLCRCRRSCRCSCRRPPPRARHPERSPALFLFPAAFWRARGAVEGSLLLSSSPLVSPAELSLKNATLGPIGEYPRPLSCRRYNDF